MYWKPGPAQFFDDFSLILLNTSTYTNFELHIKEIPQVLVAKYVTIFGPSFL